MKRPGIKRHGGYFSLLAVASCLAVATVFVGVAGADPGAAGNSVSSGNADALNGSTASGCSLATGAATASGDCPAPPPAPRPVVIVQPSITPSVTPSAAATAVRPAAAPSAALALTGSMSMQLASLAALLLLVGASAVLLTRERSNSPA